MLEAAIVSQLLTMAKEMPEKRAWNAVAPLAVPVPAGPDDAYVAPMMAYNVDTMDTSSMKVTSDGVCAHGT